MTDIDWGDNLSDNEVIARVNKIGFDKYGRPTAWGHDFAKWFLSGGRDEFVRDQLDVDEGMTALYAGKRTLRIAANREDRAEMERQMAALGITGRGEMFYRMLWGKEDAPAIPRRSGGGRAGFGVGVTDADLMELERQMHVSGVTDPTEMFRRMLWDGARLVCAGGIRAAMPGGGGITGKLNFDTLLTEPVMDYTVEAADILSDIARLADVWPTIGIDWPGMTRYGYGLALAVARRHMREIAAGSIPVTALDRAEAGIGPDDPDTLVASLDDVRRFFETLMRRPMDVKVDGGAVAAGARPGSGALLAKHDYEWFVKTYAKRPREKYVNIVVNIAEDDRAEMRRQVRECGIWRYSVLFRRMLWGHYTGFPTWEEARSAPVPEPEPRKRETLGLNCTVSDRAEMDRQMRELRVNNRSEMFRMLLWAHAAATARSGHIPHPDAVRAREEIAGLLGMGRRECQKWPDIGRRGHGLALTVARHHMAELMAGMIPVSGEDARDAGISPYGGEARRLYMGVLPEFFGAALGMSMRLVVAQPRRLVVPNGGGAGVG